jgi:hypothetical protein
MRRLLRAIPVAVFLLSSSLVFAQTTGEIIGHVADEQGGALPGVVVEARSPALQGVRTSISDATGTFRLVQLPPGAYKVTATLQGFTRGEQAVTVSLAKSSTMDVRLRPAVKEDIVVSAEAPTVDTTATTIGSNFDNQQIRTLPTGRSYTSVVLVAPGVTTQASNTNTFAGTIAIYGSSGLENSFILDGADTTGVEYGSQGKDLNFEFIQEVEVKAGGYQAEFGRATGGIVNVITKSGGNEFHGDVFGYYNADSLQANNKFPDENLYGTNQGFSRYDGGVDVGGYAWKDRIWFFGAYDRVQGKVLNELTTGPNDGDIVSSPTVRNLGSAKLTFMLNPSNTIVGSFFQDPTTNTGAINDGAHSLNGSLSTFLGRQDLGGQDWAARYTGLFGSSWVASANFALHQERNAVGPATVEGAAIQFINSLPPNGNNTASGGFGLIQNKAFKRYFYGGSVEKFLGSHEIKGGIEYEQEDATVTKRMSGGQQVTLVENLVNPGQTVYRHFYWTTPTASLPDDVPTSQLNATPQHKGLSAYLQDSWAVMPNLSVNVGVRWDQQKIYDSVGNLQINLNDSFAPRVGVIWDPTADHKTKVYGSFGYFYEQIPMDLVIRSYSFERQPVIYNFDPTSVVPNVTAATDCCADSDPGAVAGGGGKILGGFEDLADPGLKGQYVREFIFGGEHEIMPSLAVGAKYIYRNLGRVIEDYVCSDQADYCIGNPGVGNMATLFDLNYEPGFPTPKAQRIYRGAEVTVSKNFSNNWSMVASYLWSNLTGNFDGGFSPYTQPFGTADPNISAAYDYYDFFTAGPVPPGGAALPYHGTGKLSNDRASQIKLYGTYVTPFNLNLGLAAYYRTGTPITRLGYSGAYGRWEYLLSPRGLDGRVPSDYEVDLHFGYPLVVGPVTVNALVDIFSLLNVQRATFLDESYNTAEFQDPNHICGTGGPDDANCNQFYKSPLARTQPRSVRFGLRVSF